jgi:predicted dienelactone hydrolase
VVTTVRTGGRRRWVRRVLAAILAVALAVLILAGGYVGYVAYRHTGPVTLPAPTGAYRVGRVMFDWTDSTRTDPLAPHPGTARELSVWLWYPAPPDTTGKPAPYAPGAWGRMHLPSIASLGETSFGAVRVHSLDAAPVAPGRFPIVVLEPGLGFAAPQYTGIAENLASYGYLVAGVTPTYSANTTVLNGHLVPASTAGNPPGFGGANLHVGAAQQAGDRLVAVWADDARFAAAQVAALDGSSRFAGHIDPARTAYVGHSFGGAASLQACHDDPRCAAAANLDGTQYGSVVHTGLGLPTLTMASDDSCVTGTCKVATTGDRADQATARALLAASTGPAWGYQIAGMRHFNFTDYDAYYLAEPLRRRLALGPIDRNRGLTITNAYLAAFLDHAVRGQPEPVLAGPARQYPEVRVQRTGS